MTDADLPDPADVPLHQHPAHHFNEHHGLGGSMVPMPRFTLWRRGVGERFERDEAGYRAYVDRGAFLEDARAALLEDALVYHAAGDDEKATICETLADGLTGRAA